MSGGKDRKRASRAQGWEEAGEEFYRESYPGEIESLPKDPSHLATLLPSKQNRAGTNRRIGTDKNTMSSSTCRRRGSTLGGTRRRRDSTIMRGNDVQVAMLPDLSENLTDEERTWEEIREIKAMPVTMTQKKELKAQLQSAEKLRLQGLDQLKWQQRKFRQLFGTKWKETYSKLELWKNSLKKLEGNFGTGVVAYFLFIKWLMFLNMIIFCIMFCTIILPTFLLEQPISQKCDDGEPNSTECCSESYMKSNLAYSPILDIIQGTGLMEKTLMFYGVYTHHIYGYQPYIHNNITIMENDESLYYDLPLAYIAATIVVYLLSLIAIVKSAAQGFKERLVEREGQFYQYCNLVFGGWDFCIHNEKSAAIKHKAIYNEIQASLQAERLEEERHSRSTEERSKLIVIRFVVNFIIIMLLIGAGTLIYFVFNFSHFTLMNKDNSESELTSNLETLFYEFLPSLTIVLLNIFIPLLLNHFVALEKYSPLSVVRITLLRTVFLRLSSLAVLLSRFYFLIVKDLKEKDCYSPGTPQCWETFVGQQFYKLFITDFAVHIFVTFFINFPRSLLVRSIDNKFTRLIGEQYFELPKHVLDIVYAQTLCWLGLFYSPFLPAIAVVYCFFMFYIKKFACLVNSKPSILIYRASRSNSLFMFVVLLSFFVAIIPVGYAIAEIMPSRSCGPFRKLSSVWHVVIMAFMTLPDNIQSVIFFFGTASFGIPAFIILSLILYYYNAVYSANKHMVLVLKKQLVLEGHDKQFLLNRLSSFIKQQQEYQKQLRHSEMERERERHNRETNNL